MNNELRLKRLDHAINVMERVQNSKKHKFDLRAWITTAFDYDPTEDDAVRCGTSCCFGGWLAVDKDAIREGLHMHRGDPTYKGHTSHDAIAEYLGVSYSEGFNLTSPSRYNCPGEQIKPADVICRLEKLREKYGKLGQN
jgi:hypothetical protein